MITNHISSKLRQITTVLTLGFAIFLVDPVHAQTGEDALRFSHRSPAVGARMLGMAGAGTIVGIADQSALFANPAGLGYFQNSVISGSFFTLSANEESLFQSPGFSGGLDHDVRDTGLGSLAYIAKAPTSRGSLVFGAAYNQVNSFTRELLFSGENASNSITDFFMPLPDEFEIRREGGEDVPYFNRDLSFIAYETFAIDIEPTLLDAYLNPDQYQDMIVDVPFLPAVTRGTVEQRGEVTEQGAMREVSFGGALEATRGIMAGLSINLAFGSYEFGRIFDEFDFQNANDGLAEDAGGIVTVPFDNLVFEETFESDLVGVNARLGFSSALSSGLRVGLMVETPTYYSVNEDYATILDVEFDNGESYSYGRNVEDDAGSGSYEYEILTPWRFGGGLAYSMAGLTAALEAEFVDWTQLELDSSDDPAYFNDINRDIRDVFRAVVNTRFGLEYALGDLLLRGGVAFQPDPRDYEFVSADDEDLNRSRTFFSAGIGYRFAQQLEVNFGWMQERFQDQYIPYAEVDDAPVVDEDVVRNRFAVGLRVFF